MSKRELKKLEKQIQDSIELLKRLEIRPCRGDNDIKQKEIEINDLKKHIVSLEKERDGYLYHWQEKSG